MADLSCMHASTQHKGIVACIKPGQKLTHGSNPHERRGVNLTQSCTKNFLRQRFVTHFTVVDDNTMALSNVWFTLAAVLVVIASPAKANNNDVFNFALNLECLEVSCSHGLLCGVLGRLFCAYVRTLLKVTETVFVRCTDFDVDTFQAILSAAQGQFYSYAAYGQSSNSSLLAGGPPAQGGKKANLGPAVQTIAAEFARDEVAHVRSL